LDTFATISHSVRFCRLKRTIRANFGRTNNPALVCQRANLARQISVCYESILSNGVKSSILRVVSVSCFFLVLPLNFNFPLLTEKIHLSVASFGVSGMKRGYIGLAVGVMVALGVFLSLPSCGHDQKLVSISVAPATVTYPSPSSGAADFTATGTYIHPPVTKDITAQVTWKTDVVELLTFTYGGPLVGEEVAPAHGNCGIAQIWATAPEGTGGSANIIVSAPSTVTVQNTSNPLCPGGSTSAGELVVTPAGTGSGTVTSSPPGISCPGTACGFPFTPPNNVVVLTATPAGGATFVGFTGGGCTPPTNPCTVTVPSGGVVNVTATFD